MTDSLLLLPTEILIGILLALEVGDILACTSTCKHLHAIIVDSLQLQYEIELYASGMLDGARGPHTLPVQERLDRIERYTAAWEQLLWTDRISLPHLAGCISPAAVSGDVVVLPQLDGTAVSMHVQQISSALRAVDEYYVAQSTPTSSPFFGIQLDSAQDLLVVSNGHTSITQIHLRSLSTSEVHPRASHHGITKETVTPRADIRDVCGDFLLEMVPGSGGKSTPTLRNWTTGLIEATGTPISSARPIFLDTRHILYTAAGGRRDAADQARLCVASLVPSGHTPAQSCSYAFALPEFLLYDVSFVDTRACTLETTPARHGCFYSDPDDRLISIELIFIDWSGRFIIDVPARTLTRYIAAHPAVPGQPAAVVPWDAWGTHGARVTHCPGYTSMSWAISGSRRATLLPRSGVDNTTMLTVLDYSPRRVARAIARGTGNVVRGSEVPAENTGAGFGALRTMLSCISTEIPVPDRLAGGMLRATICENGVLFTKRDARSNTVIDAWAYTI